MSALLALTASGLWGISDFSGGTVSRRQSPVAVVAWADMLVLLILIPLALIQGNVHISAGLIGWGTAAGLTGFSGAMAFYAAMAAGPMGVASPIAGLGVVVPVIVGICLGDRPDAAQIIGIVVGVVGVVLVSSHGSTRAGGDPKVVGLALVGALGFGGAFVFIDQTEPYGTLMALIVMRMATLVAISIGAAVSRRKLPINKADVPILLLIGAFDAAANACFGRATLIGELTVVSVLSSLYPVVTAVLARVVHNERLARIQLTGVAVTLAAIVLLAAGPSA